MKLSQIKHALNESKKMIREAEEEFGGDNFDQFLASIKEIEKHARERRVLEPNYSKEDLLADIKREIPDVDDKVVNKMADFVFGHLGESTQVTEAQTAEELEVGEPVKITGNVQFQGATGVIDSFGTGKRFVIVDLGEQGLRSFHSSDVSFNAEEEQDEFEGVEESTNPQDTITMDVPLFIRTLEFAREDAKDDMDLHDAAENALKLSANGDTLTMDNYDSIVPSDAVEEAFGYNSIKYIDNTFSKADRDAERSAGTRPSGPQRLFSECADMLHISVKQLVALAKQFPGFPEVRQLGPNKRYCDLNLFKKWVIENNIRELIAVKGWSNTKESVGEAAEDTFVSALKGLKSWQVVIMNNYYAGKYTDYRGRYYYVIASSADEAHQVVINNADAILQDLLSMKTHQGKKILPRSSALPITDKRIGEIKDGTEAGRMSTTGFKRMFGPQGPMMVKLSGGAVVDVQGQEQGVAEGYDKWGWHTSVNNGEFMPTKYGNKAYVYLHDLDNEGSKGGPQLVTVNKPAVAKKLAQQFGGKVVKTDLNTYRIVKPAEQGVTEGSVKVGDKVHHNEYGKGVVSSVSKDGKIIGVRYKNLTKNITSTGYHSANDVKKIKEQGVAEGTSNIGQQIKAAYQKIYDAGDDAVEFAYNDSPIFAQYWDEYEGDLDSIITEVDPKELQIILDELTSAVEDQGLTEGSLHNPGQEDSPVAQAITRRILMQRTDLLAKYGPEKVGQAIDEVADFVGDVDEIGSSDVSGWIRHVEQMLGNMSESDISGVLSAASMVKDYIITAEVDGTTKKFRVRGMTGPRAAKERFLKHAAYAKVLDVKPVEEKKMNEVTLGDYRKKAAMQKAQSQMGAMFARSPEEREKNTATFYKRERGLNRLKARDEAARKAEQERQLADTIARLPELKAEYERMRAEYKSLGGSDWQYADREQNLTDSERKARAMEGPMNNLWRQINAAEKAQGSK